MRIISKKTADQLGIVERIPATDVYEVLIAEDAWYDANRMAERVLREDNLAEVWTLGWDLHTYFLVQLTEEKAADIAKRPATLHFRRVPGEFAYTPDRRQTVFIRHSFTPSDTCRQLAQDYSQKILARLENE